MYNYATKEVAERKEPIKYRKELERNGILKYDINGLSCGQAIDTCYQTYNTYPQQRSNNTFWNCVFMNFSSNYFLLHRLRDTPKQVQNKK